MASRPSTMAAQGREMRRKTGIGEKRASTFVPSTTRGVFDSLLMANLSQSKSDATHITAPRAP